jgi:hypothetical protein
VVYGACSEALVERSAQCRRLAPVERVTVWVEELVEETVSSVQRRAVLVEGNSCNGRLLLVERAAVVERVLVEEIRRQK